LNRTWLKIKILRHINITKSLERIHVISMH
jgi:hypothetical protein